MKIYYDPSCRSWHHNENSDDIPWGFKKNGIIKALNVIPSSFVPAFNLMIKDGKAGPLAGIMTGTSSRGKGFGGNSSQFKAIHTALEKAGGGCIVFTPQGISDKGIEGFMYVGSKAKWMKIHAPLPDLVYNRIPGRSAEQSREVQGATQFFQSLSIPFFNPSFFSKWTVYSILKQRKPLQPFLPETIQVLTGQQLSTFLKKHQKLYLKPADGSKGKGIFTVELQKNGSLAVNKISHSPLFQTFREFWLSSREIFTEKDYIAQPFIQSDILDGSRYDLRVLVHKTGESFKVSGVGVRKAVSQQVTTHVPNGGMLVPFETISQRVNQNTIALLARECGEALTESLGLVGEFSMDIGVTKDYQLMLYEINSKPMVFDEPHIQSQGIDNLVACFHSVWNVKEGNAPSLLNK